MISSIVCSHIFDRLFSTLFLAAIAVARWNDRSSFANSSTLWSEAFISSSRSSIAANSSGVIRSAHKPANSVSRIIRASAQSASDFSSVSIPLLSQGLVKRGRLLGYVASAAGAHANQTNEGQ